MNFSDFPSLVPFSNPAFTALKSINEHTIFNYFAKLPVLEPIYGKLFQNKNRFGVKLRIWGHFGSNFKIDAKYENHISNWSSWHQLLTKAGVKVIRGHPRSKIAEKGSIFNFLILESRFHASFFATYFFRRSIFYFEK